MRSIQVTAGKHSYEVLIAPGLLGQIGPLVRPLVRGASCAVISDANVAPLYGEKVCASLRAAGFTTDLLTVPAGEESKSIAQVGELCQRLSELGLDRTSFLVSLGGGMIGDLAGFVAAVFMRGIASISLPTTLLAQVDSCIGGKTGVNTGAGKNLIGAFHHPSLVLADTEILQTLPARVWNEGFAEAIKHAVIRDSALLESIQQFDRSDLASFVERNLTIKAEIVAADERERTDTRSLLNFGHTIGHAIEHAAGHGELLHGEAISLGMVAAAQVSVRRAGLSLGEAARIKDALRLHQLPVALPSGFAREKIFEALPRDKKFEGGKIRFVVAHAIGRASVSDEVTMEDMRAAIDAL